MKPLLTLIAIILCTNLFCQQSQDTVSLSPQQLFEFNSKWNNLGVSQIYVDFSKDVLSNSDLSFGVVGRKVSTTLNLSYNIQSANDNWSHMILSSINPVWKYYGLGYGFSHTTDKRVTTLQSMISSDFKFQNNINLNFIDIYKTKKIGKLGWGITLSKTYWDEWQGPWEGQYIVDSLGNWVSNIYPINPPSNQLSTRAIIMYTYTFKTKIVDISPQTFITSDIHKVFKSPELQISYFDNLNLDIYYGVCMNWKITNKFRLNTTLRFNNTYDKQNLGFKKSNPILFMIGTSF